MNPYMGHELQLAGVEEHRLVGGKGDGMLKFLQPGGNKRYEVKVAVKG